jgi:CheY-like chemotaxis protein
MPELDGFELAGRLRQYRPDLPVIVITASETEGISEFRTKGIQRLVSKEELADSLGRTVEEVLTECRAQGRTPSR